MNTASAMLLRYVSGLGPALASTIGAHCDQHGPFHSRLQLLNARVRVKVLAVDAARNRISLSIKQANDHDG